MSFEYSVTLNVKGENTEKSKNQFKDFIDHFVKDSSPNIGSVLQELKESFHDTGNDMFIDSLSRLIGSSKGTEYSSLYESFGDIKNIPESILNHLIDIVYLNSTCVHSERIIKVDHNLNEIEIFYISKGGQALNFFKMFSSVEFSDLIFHMTYESEDNKDRYILTFKNGEIVEEREMKPVEVRLIENREEYIKFIDDTLNNRFDVKEEHLECFPKVDDVWWDYHEDEEEESFWYEFDTETGKVLYVSYELQSSRITY